MWEFIDSGVFECVCAYKTASFRLTSFTEILKFLEVLNKKAREVSDEGALTQSAYRSSGGRLACGIELWSVSVKLHSQGFICSLPQRSSIVPFEIHLGFCLNLVVTFAGCLLIVSTFIPVYFVFALPELIPEFLGANIGSRGKLQYFKVLQYFTSWYCVDILTARINNCSFFNVISMGKRDWPLLIVCKKMKCTVTLGR